MQYGHIILSIIFIPVIGAFVLPLLGRVSARLRNYSALILVFASFLLSAVILGQVLSGKIITVNKQLAIGLNFVFTADALAVFMALVSSLISTIVVFYSFSYISHYPNQNEYYSMVVLFLGSMMGLVFAANLILLYVFWELTAISSWRLIGFFREKTHIIKADKAFLVTALGALLMLVGFIAIYQETGSFDLAIIKEYYKLNPISNIIIFLVLAGILSKSATLPFHSWLPDAGLAPSPVTALLHAAVLVKIGVYVFTRLFIATFSIPHFFQTTVLFIAGISALVSAGAALIETDLKRIIAYSTISQIGFIFLGLASGSEIGIIGGLLYILMHGLAKGGLFLCAGIVEQNTKTKDITKLGGLIKTMPITAAAFLFCAFSVMGLPPFGGFFSKYMVFFGAIEAGQIGITFVFLVGAFMTILYLLRLFKLVFLGQARIPAIEASRSMVACVVVLAILSLLGGIFIKYPYNFAEYAVAQALGAVK